MIGSLTKYGRSVVVFLSFLMLAGLSGLPATSQESNQDESESATADQTESANAPERTSVKESVKQLVHQLKHRSYSKRKQAQEKLIDIGPEALPHLKPYRDHRDPEVQNRVRKTITMIKTETKRERLRKGPALTLPRKEWTAKKLVQHLNSEHDYNVKLKKHQAQNKTVTLPARKTRFFDILDFLCRYLNLRVYPERTSREESRQFHLVSNDSKRPVPYYQEGSFWIQPRSMKLKDHNTKEAKFRNVIKQSSETDHRTEIRLYFLHDPKVPFIRIKDLNIEKAVTDAGEDLTETNNRDRNLMSRFILRSYGRLYSRKITLSYPEEEDSTMIKELSGTLIVRTATRHKTLRLPLSSPEDSTGDSTRKSMMSMELEKWNTSSNEMDLHIVMDEEKAEQKEISHLYSLPLNPVIKTPDDETVTLDLEGTSSRNNEVTYQYEYRNNEEIPEGSEIVLQFPDQFFDYEVNWNLNEFPFPFFTD